jgi:hypothetical protein
MELLLWNVTMAGRLYKAVWFLHTLPTSFGCSVREMV